MQLDTRSALIEIAKRFLHNVRVQGDHATAACPFHTSDNPGGSTTFSMSLSRGIYFCFSCHASGNLKSFLQQNGVGPTLVALQYGDLIERLREQAPAAKDPRSYDPRGMEQLPENLLGLFDFCPRVLRDAGFSEETLRYFDVGYDHYHERITYPLRNVDGTLVGISGRRIAGDGPRYKIYTQEYKVWGLPAYVQPDKRYLLWNIHRAAAAAEVGGLPLIIVEGFKGCMWMHQCGYPNVTALLGSSVTTEQMWMLQHLGVPIILMLDGDQPGREGTDRCGRILAKSMHIRVARVPDDEQPDDLLKEQIDRIVNNTVVFQLWSAAQPIRRKIVWKDNDPSP